MSVRKIQSDSAKARNLAEGGLTHREIAQRLGVSQPTVSRRLVDSESNTTSRRPLSEQLRSLPDETLRKLITAAALEGERRWCKHPPPCEPAPPGPVDRMMRQLDRKHGYKAGQRE